jgi:chaperonin GroEL
MKLLSGALQVAKAVATTHGPLGRTALIHRMSGLIDTKDGLTVAREIFLPDPVENLGARILQEACIRVNTEAGDGTTATAIMAATMLKEGFKAIAAGDSPTKLVAGMDVAVSEACAFIRNLAVPVNGKNAIERIALVAGNGDEEIAGLMADACMAIGKDGTVAVEDGQGVDSSLEFKEGFEFPKGTANPAFLTGQSERVLDDALVAVTTLPLHTINDVKDILETASQWPRNGLVVFAPAILGDALRTMLLNDTKNVVKCVAVQVPGHRTREFLDDVVALSGATLVDPSAGMSNQVWNAEWFGTLRKVVVKKESAFLEAYDEKAQNTRNQIARLKTESERLTSSFDKDRFKERIARLSGGLAILKVGGVTEAALKERRARVEDMLGAVRASLKGGIVPGGGVACFLASKVKNRIVSTALMAPIKSLARNADMHWMSITPLAGMDPWTGWDFVQNRLRNLAEDPLIADAALAVEAGIRAAGSVARTLLLADATVTHPAWNDTFSGSLRRR